MKINAASNQLMIKDDEINSIKKMAKEEQDKLQKKITQLKKEIENKQKENISMKVVKLMSANK